MTTSTSPGPEAPYVRDSAIMLRIVNPLVRHLHLGATLIVRGRKTGRSIEIPLGEPLELEGRHYLVSGRGNTNWARNLRAAGTGVLRSHGRMEEFRAVEVTGADRERVVSEYRRKLGRAVEGMFRQIPDPADHPVFLVEACAPRPAAR